MIYCELYLKQDVNVRDVEKVIKRLVKCNPRVYPSRKVRGAETVQLRSLGRFPGPDADMIRSAQFVPDQDVPESRKYAYGEPKHANLFAARSTNFWVAVIKRIAAVFGGKVYYQIIRDGNFDRVGIGEGTVREKNFRRSKKVGTPRNGRWKGLYEAINAMPPLSDREVEEVTEAAYEPRMWKE